MTLLVVIEIVHMFDVIWIKPALSVRFLIGELTFLEVIQKSLVGHDVSRIERTLHGLDDFSLS
jgi:hypothetical protein